MPSRAPAATPPPSHRKHPQELRFTGFSDANVRVLEPRGRCSRPFFGVYFHRRGIRALKPRLATGDRFLGAEVSNPHSLYGFRTGPSPREIKLQLDPPGMETARNSSFGPFGPEVKVGFFGGDAPSCWSRSAPRAPRGRSATLGLTVGLPLDGWGGVIVLTGIQYVGCLTGALEQRSIAVALRVCWRGVKDVPATAHRAFVVRHEQPKTVEPPRLKSDPARFVSGDLEKPNDFVDRSPAHGLRSSIGRPRIPRVRQRPLITPFRDPGKGHDLVGSKRSGFQIVGFSDRSVVKAPRYVCFADRP